MAELKSIPDNEQVNEFLGNIDDEIKRNDCFTLVKLMKQITGAEPKMWGGSIVGFGNYHYKYESGREGDWFLTGFSPRKHNLSLYIMAGFDQYAELMEGLGKYKTGKSCLYIKNLQDVDLSILKKLIKQSTEHVARKYS